MHTEEKNHHLLSTRVTEGIGKKFRSLAAKEGKTVADVLREMIESYCHD